MHQKINFRALYVAGCQSSIVFLFLFYSIHCEAQVKKINIACIGNSITAGARLTHPEVESYPAVLAQTLQEKGYVNFEVRNFGIGGATLLRFGQPNLWRILDSLKNFPPNVVVIKAGTNETVGPPRFNWEHIHEFEKDYSDYVAAIRKINPACRIVICSPLDMVIETKGLSPQRTEDLSGRRPRIWELRKRIKKIARVEHLYFLDLTRPFKGKPHLMTTSDGVHPNQEGYHYLAELVFRFLSKKKLVVK